MELCAATQALQRGQAAILVLAFRPQLDGAADRTGGVVVAWANQYGKLRWCTERCWLVIEFWLALALAVITLGRLIRRAWTHCRWEGRPRRRP